jgi:DNA-binding response OmpR family regulator
MALILVVDDEPDVLLLCRINLEHAGHRVIEAPGGEQGLALARERRPDAMILDLMMPNVDGYEVLRGLNEGPASVDLPVVVLTAKARQQDRVRCLRGGADEFVTKPFSPESLVDTVEQLLAMDPGSRAADRRAELQSTVVSWILKNN